MPGKKIFIAAGEASGDAHAARLIVEAKKIMPDLSFEGLGGEKMRRAGCEIRTDIASMAVMGFVRVLANIRFFKRLLSESIEFIASQRPDVVVLVDYPGFNMRLAAGIKELGIPIIYYISPQIWAWRSGRIKKIAKLVDKMMVILPFEEDIYSSAGIDVAHVGHPLIDSISESEADPDFLKNLGDPDPAAIIGLLPGSRKQEISAFMPILLETAKIILKKMPTARFLIPCSDGDAKEMISDIIGAEDIPAELLEGKMHDVARAARCCIVASGTATLEVACFSTPLVVVYKTGHLFYLMGKMFLNVDHISLVNIIAGKEIVPEMLQYKMRPDMIAETVVELCTDGDRRATMIEELGRVRKMLGEPGASRRAAKVVCEALDLGVHRPSAAGAAGKLVNADG